MVTERKPGVCAAALRGVMHTRRNGTKTRANIDRMTVTE
jgi:hypothetical protein